MIWNAYDTVDLLENILVSIHGMEDGHRLENNRNTTKTPKFALSKLIAGTLNDRFTQPTRSSFSNLKAILTPPFPFLSQQRWNTRLYKKSERLDMGSHVARKEVC